MVIAIRSNRMASLRESFFNGKGMSLNPLVEGLIKENEFDLPEDDFTPEATDDVSNPLLIDTLPPEEKAAAEKILSIFKQNVAGGVKYSVKMNGRNIPVEKLVPIKDKMKNEYEKEAAENPAESHDDSNMISLVGEKGGKKKVTKLPIPILLYILDNLDAPVAASVESAVPVQEDFSDAVVSGAGATAGVIGSVGLIALGIWAWTRGNEMVVNIGQEIGNALGNVADNAKIAKNNKKMQEMLKRFDGDANFQQLVASLKATPYKRNDNGANQQRSPNIKALKDYIESKLSPEERGYLTALYDAAK